MSAPKIKTLHRIKFMFSDGSEESVSLEDHWEALLDQYQRMIASDDPILRNGGTARIKEVAQILAAQTIIGQKRKRSTQLAAAARRKIGTATKARVLKGKNPAVGARQQRRIKAKSKQVDARAVADTSAGYVRPLGKSAL